jgi:hypothetical protein
VTGHADQDAQSAHPPFTKIYDKEMIIILFEAKY